MGNTLFDQFSACIILVIYRILKAVITLNITVNVRQNRMANHEWKI